MYNTLYYFKYNSKAQICELNALNNFKKYLKQYINKNQLNIRVIAKVINVESIFRIFSNNSSLIRDNSRTNGNVEFRSNSAYVPFRNTIFTEFIANDIQMNKYLNNTNTSKKIVMGLNLSEGQIYGDNNQAWLTNMNRVLESGGKYFDISIELYAPFINKTKTNMIKFFIREVGYDQFNDLKKISFSCYYPDRNCEPCGKCGSCLLREQAISRALEIEEN
jgi:7-cyano-7-deazaguanine synthase in queuosine biosynthesis